MNENEYLEVAGVYLRRDGALLVHAKFYNPARKEAKWVGLWPENLSYVNHVELSWDRNQKNAKKCLKKLAEYIGDHSSIHSVSVGSYGPFCSLDPKDAAYGQIDDYAANEPLRGLSLKLEFERVLGQSVIDGHVKLTFHTDVSACALGEAYERRTGQDDLLAFFSVTEGIGLGVVSGATIIQSALHPEVGLMSVRFADNDPLVQNLQSAYSNPIQPDSSAFDETLTAKHLEFYGSLEEFASNPSIRKRLKIGCPLETAWELRAYYVAQACLSLLTVLPPHYIVVGTDLDSMRYEGLAERVEDILKKYLKVRMIEERPLFSYRALNKFGFLSEPNQASGDYLSNNGVIGLCCAAAHSLARGPVPVP